MSIRPAVAVAAFTVFALISAVALSRGDAADSKLPRGAVAVADRFVGRLVEDPSRETGIDLSIGVVQDDMAYWRRFLDREGIRKVERGGEVQENCETSFPAFAPDRRYRDDCVVYLVSNPPQKPEPGAGNVLTARIRVWLIERRGQWRVAEIEITPRLGFRSISKGFHVEGY